MFLFSFKVVYIVVGIDSVKDCTKMQKFASQNMHHSFLIRKIRQFCFIYTLMVSHSIVHKILKVSENYAEKDIKHNELFNIMFIYSLHLKKKKINVNESFLVS